MYLLACDLCGKVIEGTKQINEREIDITFMDPGKIWKDGYFRRFQLCKEPCTEKFDTIISKLLSRKNPDACKICGNKLNTWDIRVGNPHSYNAILFATVCTNCKESFNEKINSLFEKERKKKNGQTD